MTFFGALLLPMSLLMALVYLKLWRKQSGCAPILAFVFGTYPGIAVVALILFRLGNVLPVVSLISLAVGAMAGGALAAELYRTVFGKPRDPGGDGMGLNP